MLGLWLLARQSKTGRLVHAGAHQAEYHVWLATSEAETEFLDLAWRQLKSTLQFGTLQFKYLPSTQCVAALQRVGALAGAMSHVVCARPLIRLESGDIESSFAKKSNKSRFNRLKRMGKLDFQTLESTADLDRVLDDFCAQYDFRQGAVNQATPFCDDPIKRAFHTEVFALAQPGECCVSVSLLDNRLISGLWGMRSGAMVHLGMLAHSPELADHSPGKLHIMQLSRALVSGGTAVLDLTPGGDPWKERFANDHDEVAIAELFSAPAHRAAQAAKERALSAAKQLAARVGVTPAGVRRTLSAVRRVRPAAIWRRLRRWVGEDKEFRIYRAERAVAERHQLDPRVGRNDLPALLAFSPGESWQTRQGFLSSALHRVEAGEAAYSIAVAGRLAHCGWMSRGQTESRMTEVDQMMQFPPGSVALYDFYSHPDFRGQGFYRATLGHMLREAFSFEDTRFAYISVLADNGPSRHVIEAVGFEYQGSFHLRKRLSKVKKWADQSVRPMVGCGCLA